jgi:hypothetical protein
MILVSQAQYFNENIVSNFLLTRIHASVNIVSVSRKGSLPHVEGTLNEVAQSKRGLEVVASKPREKFRQHFGLDPEALTNHKPELARAQASTSSIFGGIGAFCQHGG